MSDSKQYRVRDGVAWVNGARVPDDRMVWLSEIEARFDLEQGRIEPGDTPVVQSSARLVAGLALLRFRLAERTLPTMAGIDRHTGKVIDNLASACQGVEVILSTRIGSRVMRREFGGGIAELLGRLMTPALFAAWRQLVATAIDLWEPRFRVRKVMLDGSTEALWLGSAHMTIEAEFRPRGHLGDFTVERVVTFGIDFGQRVRVT